MHPQSSPNGKSIRIASFRAGTADAVGTALSPSPVDPCAPPSRAPVRLSVRSPALAEDAEKKCLEPTASRPTRRKQAVDAKLIPTPARVASDPRKWADAALIRGTWRGSSSSEVSVDPLIASSKSVGRRALVWAFGIVRCRCKCNWPDRKQGLRRALGPLKPFEERLRSFAGGFHGLTREWPPATR